MAANSVTPFESICATLRSVIAGPITVYSTVWTQHGRGMVRDAERWGFTPEHQHTVLQLVAEAEAAIVKVRGSLA